MLRNDFEGKAREVDVLREELYSTHFTGASCFVMSVDTSELKSPLGSTNAVSEGNSKEDKEGEDGD